MARRRPCAGAASSSSRPAHPKPLAHKLKANRLCVQRRRRPPRPAAAMLLSRGCCPAERSDLCASCISCLSPGHVLTARRHACGWRCRSYQVLKHFEGLYFGTPAAATSSSKRRKTTTAGAAGAGAAAGTMVPDRCQSLANTLTWLVVTHLTSDDEEGFYPMLEAAHLSSLQEGDQMYDEQGLLETVLQEALQAPSLFRSVFEHLALNLDLAKSDAEGLTFELCVVVAGHALPFFRSPMRCHV